MRIEKAEHIISMGGCTEATDIYLKHQVGPVEFHFAVRVYEGRAYLYEGVNPAMPLDEQGPIVTQDAEIVEAS